jgi:hypothetical protein
MTPEVQAKLAYVVLGSVLILGLGGTAMVRINSQPKPLPQAVAVQLKLANEAADRAQQAATDAKAQADAIRNMTVTAQKSVEDAKRAADNSPDLPTEHTGYGRIIEVQQINDITSITFREDAGFQKQIYPLCNGQVLQTGVTTSIAFHWHKWHDNNIGCFMIESYQNK